MWAASSFKRWQVHSKIEFQIEDRKDMWAASRSKRRQGQSKIEFQNEYGKGMWAASSEEGRCKAKLNFKLNIAEACGQPTPPSMPQPTGQPTPHTTGVGGGFHASLHPKCRRRGVSYHLAPRCGGSKPPRGVSCHLAPRCGGTRPPEWSWGGVSGHPAPPTYMAIIVNYCQKPSLGALSS